MSETFDDKGISEGTQDNERVVRKEPSNKKSSLHHLAEVSHRAHKPSNSHFSRVIEMVKNCCK